ncbi:MAG TPA: HmuY family protein, partial [Polyangiaceae bacterium]
DWDLAFQGFDIFTNGGVSGGGKGSAFGPLDALQFLEDGPPDVPFMTSDQAGGAFLKWYAYDSNGHVLYSRFHVYGVKSGSSLFKVQILTYYAVQNGAATSGLYQIRYADITSGQGKEHDLTIDGTAGGVSGPATAPSGCLDLASGNVTMLAPADAATSTAWDLCFRRETVSVNGEVGGPRGVGAIDLEASAVATEVLSDVEAETADGEKVVFDDADASAFTNAQFRGDHVVSAFESGGWLDSAQSPPEPVQKSWVVQDAGGTKKFLVGFDAFQNPTTQSPGTVVMHIKPVGG